MKFKSLLWALCLVLVVSLVGVAATSAQDSQATLSIINFVGGEMTFTLDGMPYSIPGTDTAPGGGQMSFSVSPGRHTYSGHVPGSEGANGEVSFMAGETQVLGARLERSQPVVSPAGVVLEEPGDVLVFFQASLTPPSPALAPQPAPLQPLPAGQGALVLVNYIGEALLVDIGGNLYSVPANQRLQVNLPPSEVSFSASAGPSGTNGTAQVTSGVYTGLGFTREVPPQEPDYDVGKLAPTPVPLKISVFPVSLAEEPVGQAASAAQAELPNADVAPPTVDAPTGQGRLTVVNYVGEPLTFTIEDQTYSVAESGGSLSINLLPGEYTFTASTPRAGANRSLRVIAGATTRASALLDFQSGDMKIYIELED